MSSTTTSLARLLDDALQALPLAALVFVLFSLDQLTATIAAARLSVKADVSDLVSAAQRHRSPERVPEISKTMKPRLRNITLTLGNLKRRYAQICREKYAKRVEVRPAS